MVVIRRNRGSLLQKGHVGAVLTGKRTTQAVHHGAGGWRGVDVQWTALVDLVYESTVHRLQKAKGYTIKAGGFTICG
jgi:hypothetical protein